MKEITRKWVLFARADLDAAELQFRYGGKRGSAYQIAVFHCHQAIEKLLKAHFIEQDKEVRKNHDLIQLRTEINLEFPKELSVIIENLHPHYLLPRYPDLAFRPAFSFSYTRSNTRKILSDTSKLFLWLERLLKKKK